MVERAPMDAGLHDVARRYVLYRRRRAEFRDAKRMLGARDEAPHALQQWTSARRARVAARDDAGAALNPTEQTTLKTIISVRP